LHRLPNGVIGSGLSRRRDASERREEGNSKWPMEKTADSAGPRSLPGAQDLSEAVESAEEGNPAAWDGQGCLLESRGKYHVPSFASWRLLTRMQHLSKRLLESLKNCLSLSIRIRPPTLECCKEVNGSVGR